VSPSNHCTIPPGIERQAEPEPWRAKIDNSDSDNLSPAAFAPATVSAANPEAEEERPVPVGKEFSETTLAKVPVPANFLIRSKCLETLTASFSLFSLLIVISSAVKSFTNSTVVVVNKFERDKERLPFIGRRRVSSLRPQYLVKAILDGAIAVDFIL